MELFKVCPQCGSEFVPRVDTCIDCGSALVWADQRVLEMQRASELPVPAESSGELPEDAVAIRQAGLSWIDHLARALSDRGIQPFIREEVTPDPDPASSRRLGSFGQGWYYTLYVRPEDLDKAEEIDKEVYAREMPGLRSTEVDVAAGCPACGAFLRSSEMACPSCGLEIPEEPGVETPG